MQIVSFQYNFSLLESLCKTKDSLKSLKGQLKENLKENNSLAKTVRDLESMNAEVKYATLVRWSFQRGRGCEENKSLL